jgi:hypothetical protein
VSLTVADRLELADLVHRYAAAVDDRRFDDIPELFTDTAELILPDPPRHLDPVLVKRGPAGVRAALAALDTVTRTQHEIVGEVYAAGSGHATGRITCVAHHWTQTADGSTDLVWHLRYDDEYLPDPSGWRINRRALTLNAIETRPIRKLRGS